MAEINIIIHSRLVNTKEMLLIFFNNILKYFRIFNWDHYTLGMTRNRNSCSKKV